MKLREHGGGDLVDKIFVENFKQTRTLVLFSRQKLESDL